MYKKGELVIVPIDCKWDSDWHYSEENHFGDPPGHSHPWIDEDGMSPSKPMKGGVYLPHNCDEWVIGGAEEIRSLIQDLSDAYIKLYDDVPMID